MSVRNSVSIATVVSLALLGACTAHEEPGPTVTVIEPGPDVQKEAQTALIMAQPGEIIEFAEGRFEFDATLSLDVEGVTIRGRGMDATILDFSNQGPGTGGEGILVTSDGFSIEDIAVENTKADGIKVEGTNGVTFRRVRVEWAGEPRTENGAYGIYPVQCKNVIIEDSKVRGASDAGIYVGQSETIIVRRNEAWENVAGIEIENSIGADVYENAAHHNTGGLLVFSLPELQVKHGRDSRVYNNEIYDNNHPNFGLEGNIIATLPPGTGMVVMANDDTEVFNNTIRDHQTANLSVISFVATGREYDDPEYDPFPEGIYIHDNSFGDGGANPVGALAELMAPALGGAFPDIVYDGMVDPAKMVDGVLPPELGVYIENNGDASFVNLNLASVISGDEPAVTTDLAAHAGQLAMRSAPIEVEGAG